LWCTAKVRQRITAFSSRQDDSDKITPGLRLLANRSLSMNPSIFSIWGLRDFAIARYSSNRCFRGRTSKITTNIVASWA